MNPTLRTILAAALGWAAFAVAVNVVRFGRVPGSAEEIAGGLLGFALLGTLAGWRLARLLQRATARRQRAGAVGGHVLFAPAGYALGVAAPLLLEAAPPLPGTMTYLVLFPLLIAAFGSLPVLAGQHLGWLLLKPRD